MEALRVSGAKDTRTGGNPYRNIVGLATAVPGLQILDLDPIVYEGVSYSPTKLPIEAAEQLLGHW
jgi:hypothetical protein